MCTSFISHTSLADMFRVLALFFALIMACLFAGLFKRGLSGFEKCMCIVIEDLVFDWKVGKIDPFDLVGNLAILLDHIVVMNCLWTLLSTICNYHLSRSSSSSAPSPSPAPSSSSSSSPSSSSSLGEGNTEIKQIFTAKPLARLLIVWWMFVTSYTASVSISVDFDFSNERFSKFFVLLRILVNLGTAVLSVGMLSRVRSGLISSEIPLVVSLLSNFAAFLLF